MKKTTLAVLEKRAKELYAELTKTQNAIDVIENERLAPKLQALVGTCYRIPNGYSSAEHWWLYRTVMSVAGSRMLKYVDVQIDSFGNASIEGNTGYSNGLFEEGTEISRDEFDHELERVKGVLGI